jgi:tRNA A-37 threonylcarbamoyl transferase component Bud32/predicted AAA+ superfamily ATPase
MITKNPYKYKGALDPVKDQLVCIPRTSDLNRVIDGIESGEYWNILGSRQVGKSTFLRQIQNYLRNEYPIYLSFEVSPETKENFYQWLMDKIRERIPAKEKEIKINEKLGPKNRFLDFLEKFQPHEDKKIILLLDEIEGTPFLKDFLDIWRMVHESRYDIKSLERYAIITSGSTDLIGLTTGRTSPYDVAENLYLKDFSNKESEILIKRPFEKVGIIIEPKAKTELISQTGGHPQILQHACSKLVNIAYNQSGLITEKDVIHVLYLLTKENTTISLLKANMERESKLQKLTKSILKGVANSFSTNWRFSIAGAGCIEEDENQCCRIRNQVFKKVIDDIIEDLIRTDYVPPARAQQEFEFPHLPTDKYLFIEKIAEGGMGIVYKARDQHLSRFVAVKVLKPELAQNKKIRERFFREAQITAQLQHPKILTVHEVMKSDHSNAITIIMEYIYGKNLLEQLRICKPFSHLHVFYIAKELLEALDHAHNHKERVIHRDVKPSNIMINRRGEIKVLDFGLAVIRDLCKHEKTGAVVGTRNYMSPEQFMGMMVDERSDIYSCGATMFHLVTAVSPLWLQKYTYLVNFMKKKVRKGTPEILIDIIAQCMEEKKEKRFQSARELLGKLKEAEMTVLKRPTTKDDIKDIIPTETGDTTIHTLPI